MMGISLYTSRIVLQTLGVEDYGIYNVVGGLVSMFGLLNGSLSSATQRFITIEIGKGDKKRLNKVFSIALQNHAIIALVTFLLIESVGVWFLFNKMVMPENRLMPAFWVLQLSTLTFIVSILNLPYNADIIAHEKMSAFAYISIIEVVFKLAIVYVLQIIPFDKLIIYASLLVLVQIVIQFFYMIYCHRHFEESHYHYHKDIPLLKEMLYFAGWNMFGGMSSIASGQGLSMLLNVFFGPVVNAARGVAQQVQSAVQMFIINFQTALNPQIIKTYAQEDFVSMHLLMIRSSRFSFYLMWFLSLPILLETEFILRLWLGIIPDYTTIFLRIIICTSLIYTIINPILVANNATGKVKAYYIVCGCLMISILPISYAVLKTGAPPYSVFVVHFCVEMFTQLVRLLMVRDRLHLSILKYVKDVYARIAIVVVISLVLPLIAHSMMPDSITRFFLIGALCVLSVSLTAYACGLSASERTFINSKLRTILSKVKK